MVTRGFTGRGRSSDTASRIPPGQYLEHDFPVLSAGPTPQIEPEDVTFTLKVGPKAVKTWSWAELQALPQTDVTRDIHCVTKWSKFDTVWEGVSIDDLLAAAGVAPPSPWLLALSNDDYDTNVPVADLLGGRAMVATHFDGASLAAEHGGPARLLVPHLYFWKSAQWIQGMRFTARDDAGFWELRGYHMYGDPWRQQLYSDDP